MLSSRGRAAGAPQRAFWGQFPRVSWTANAHWLSHSDFFWDLYFSGSHYRQFLSGLHYPLFSAAQIQKDRWRGGRGLRGLIGQNGDYKLPIMHHTVEAKGLDKEVKNLISMTKEPWIRPLCDNLHTWCLNGASCFFILEHQWSNWALRLKLFQKMQFSCPVFKSDQHYILTSNSNNSVFMKMCELISIFYMSYFWYCVHESCSVLVRFSYLHFKIQTTYCTQSQWAIL